MEPQNYSMEAEIQDLRAKTADMFDRLLKEYRCLKNDNEELKGVLNQIADVITTSSLPPIEKRTPSQMIPDLMAELRGAMTPAAAPTKQDSLDAIEEEIRSTDRCPRRMTYTIGTPLKQEKEEHKSFGARHLTPEENARKQDMYRQMSTNTGIKFSDSCADKGSGYHSMELSPLMRTIPLDIEKAAATAKEIPKLVPAVKDVLTAAKRLDKIIAESSQFFDVLYTIDNYLAKYEEFEPWSVYIAAFALLMDRCWSKSDEK